MTLPTLSTFNLIKVKSNVRVVGYILYTVQQGFGAGAARSRGIWLEQEPSLLLGSTLNICLLIYENYMELDVFS